MVDGGFGVLFLLFFILAVAGLVLWIWALVDCVQVPDDSMYQSGTKLVWVLIIVFLSWIGALLYLAIGRPTAATRAAPASGRTPPPSVGGPSADRSHVGGTRETPPMPPPPD
jgi:hypothetical protein